MAAVSGEHNETAGETTDYLEKKATGLDWTMSLQLTKIHWKVDTVTWPENLFPSIYMYPILIPGKNTKQTLTGFKL